MSKWESWIESQQKTVEADGVCAATIKLEAPDGGVWGTWPAKTPELAEIIHQAIELLVEDLPKERHSCRLVSYDSKGEQLAVMPHAIVGRSAEAGKIANRDRSHAQATAVHLGNAEQVLGIQSRQLERLNIQGTELFEDNLELRQKLVELMTDTLALRTDDRLAQERLAVFRDLATTAKPMLESVIAMGAEFAQYKFSDFVEGLKRKELAAETLTSENERLKRELTEQKKAAEEQAAKLAAELAELAEQKAAAERERTNHAEKRKPSNGAVPDGAQRARKAPRDGSRSRQGNRGRPAGNGRRPPATRTRTH